MTALEASADQYLMASDYRNMEICILKIQRTSCKMLRQYISESCSANFIPLKKDQKDLDRSNSGKKQSLQEMTVF
jgi:hypothetical protein